MAVADMKNKKVTVMGLGLNEGGVGVVKYLVDKGAKVVVTDIKTKEQLGPSIKKLKGLQIEYILGQHRTEDFISADLVIKNPGIKNTSKQLQKATEAHVPIDTPLGLFVEEVKGPMIGVTGTRGKTTTATLLHSMIKKQHSGAVLAGNMGVSPLALLPKIKSTTPVVLELSSWQVESIAQHKKSPHIAVMTNIFPDHLNHYGSMTEYGDAKKKILKFQKPHDFIVLNHESEELREVSTGAAATVVWFSKKKLGSPMSCFLEGKAIVFRDASGNMSPIASIDDIQLQGEHNIDNVLAATAAAMALGVEPKNIQRAIKEMKSIEGRFQVIATAQGRTFINDTTSTTPKALDVALAAVKGPVVVIAGGNDKNIEYGNIASKILRKAKKIIFLKGTATDKILERTSNLPGKEIIHPTIFEDMNSAVSTALQESEEGDTILLSPGATSFGMYNNEFERGAAFVEAVQKLT